MARLGEIPSRTQSSVAVSADGRHWFLINASPDIRSQLLDLQGSESHCSRQAGFEAVLLTNADLDHTLGLMIVREGGPVSVYATAEVRRTVADALGFERILGAFIGDGTPGIDWRTLDELLVELKTKHGEPAGLTVRTVMLGGGPPRYDAKSPAGPGHACAFAIEDPKTRAKFVCALDVAGPNERLLEEIAGANLTIFDGSFWSDREMIDLGFSRRTAAQMGHWAVGGKDGSLAALASIKMAGSSMAYSHINNTNPILDPASEQANAVKAAGIEVGADGMEWDI